MELREVVEKYLKLAGGHGKPVPLASFGLSRAETERIFSIFDEDYHISRFFHLSYNPPSRQIAQNESAPVETYQINGFPQTHISIDAEIERIL